MSTAKAKPLTADEVNARLSEIGAILASTPLPHAVLPNYRELVAEHERLTAEHPHRQRCNRKTT